MKKLNQIGRVPMPQLILWWAVRASLLIFSIYGLLHGSTTQFLMGLFAIAFSHMWDMWQLFGGRSFITRVGYFSQTLLNIFLFVGIIIGYVLNTKTNFAYADLIEHFTAGVVASYFAYDFAIAFQGKSRHLSPALASVFAICPINNSVPIERISATRINTSKRNCPVRDARRAHCAAAVSDSISIGLSRWLPHLRTVHLKPPLRCGSSVMISWATSSMVS